MVAQDDRRPVRTGEVLVSPSHQHRGRSEQLATGLLFCSAHGAVVVVGTALAAGTTAAEGTVSVVKGKIYPEITGSAYVTAKARLILEADDPFRLGIRP